MKMPSNSGIKVPSLAFACLLAFASCSVGQQASNSETRELASPEICQDFEIRLEIFQRLNVSTKRDGFLATASLAPGTVIQKGQVLAELATEKKLLEAKRLQAEILSLKNQAANLTELVRAKQEVRVSELRNQELSVAARLTRIPRMEMLEAASALETSKAAVVGAMQRQRESEYRLEAKQAELEIINLDIKQSTILAPFDGIVFKQFKHIGEAVALGEPLAEIYRLDYLLGTVLLKQGDIAPGEFASVSGTVSIEVPRQGDRSFEFSLPRTLPRVERDGRFLAVIKVKNQKNKADDAWVLLPGMHGTLLTNGSTNRRVVKVDK